MPSAEAVRHRDHRLVADLADEPRQNSRARRGEDVSDAISRKLVRRHPHVFGQVVAETPDAVIRTWEGVKAAERAANGAPSPAMDPLERLPRAMPPLRKAIEVLAPRVTLRGPRDPSDGAVLLSAVESLLAQGVDPERALESALRARAARSVAADGAETFEMTATNRGEKPG